MAIRGRASGQSGNERGKINKNQFSQHNKVTGAFSFLPVSREEWSLKSKIDGESWKVEEEFREVADKVIRVRVTVIL